MGFNNNTKLIISVSNNPTNFGVTIYNYVFSKMSLNYIYLPFKIDDEKKVTNIIRDLNLVGCSVSSPLKSKMISHMDKLDKKTRMLNNLNTIKNNDGELHGFNTDYFGFKSLIEDKYFDKVLIYGNGSVAKTIVNVLKDTGVNKIYASGRNQENVEKFIKAHSLINYKNQKVDLFINATPAGYVKTNDEIFKYLNFCKTLIDLNVSNSSTSLVQEAKKMNINIFEGTDMSINQLIAQFEIYTDIQPDKKLFKEGLELYFQN